MEYFKTKNKLNKYIFNHNYQLQQDVKIRLIKQHVIMVILMSLEYIEVLFLNHK